MMQNAWKNERLGRYERVSRNDRLRHQQDRSRSESRRPEHEFSALSHAMTESDARQLQRRPRSPRRPMRDIHNIRERPRSPTPYSSMFSDRGSVIERRSMEGLHWEPPFIEAYIDERRDTRLAELSSRIDSMHLSNRAYDDIREREQIQEGLHLSPWEQDSINVYATLTGVTHPFSGVAAQIESLISDDTADPQSRIDNLIRFWVQQRDYAVSPQIIAALERALSIRGDTLPIFQSEAPPPVPIAHRSRLIIHDAASAEYTALSGDSTEVNRGSEDELQEEDDEWPNPYPDNDGEYV